LDATILLLLDLTSSHP